MTEYLKSYAEKFSQFKETSCEKVLPLTEKHDTETIYMVSSCPETTSEYLQHLCVDSTVDVKGYIPVIGQDTYVYKNEHCAKCHNVSHFAPLKLQIRCIKADDEMKNMKTIDIHTLQKQTRCVILIHKDNIGEKHIKKCHKLDILVPGSNCTENDRRLCNMYKAPTSLGKYKNPHCQRCATGSSNSPDVNMLKCPSRCRIDKWCFLPDEKDLSKYPVIFDVTTLTNIPDMIVTSYVTNFPIWEFFGIPLEYQFPKDEGLEQYLCSGGRVPKCCSCKFQCESGHCCVDSLWNSTQPVDMKIYKERLLDQAEKRKDKYCLPVYPLAEHLGHSSGNVMMVHSCSRHASEIDRKLCQETTINDTSLARNIPVVDKQKTLYANAFCAKCNYVYDFEYQNITLSCDEYRNKTSNESMFTSRINKCRFILKGKGECNASKISNYHVKNCIKRNDQDYFLCRSYKSKMKNHLNPHCLKCSGYKNHLQDMLSSFQHCGETPCRRDLCTTLPPQPFRPPPLPKQYRWSFILSFSGYSASIKEPDGFASCQNGYVFDIAQSECVRFTCPPNYKVMGLKCVFEKETQPFVAKPIFKNTTIPKQTNIISHMPTPEKTNVSSLHLIEPIPWHYIDNRDYRIYLQIPRDYRNTSVIVSRVNQYSTRNFTFTELVVTKYLAFKSIESISYDVAVQFHTLSNLISTQPEIKLFIAQNINHAQITKSYGLDFSRLFSDQRLCALPILKKCHNVTEYRLHTNNTMLSYANKSSHIADTVFWMEIAKGSPIVEKNLCICTGYHLQKPCLRKYFKDNETSIGDNLTLYETTHRTSYRYNEYMPTEQGYSVCVQTSLTSSYGKNTNNSINGNDDLGALYLAEHYITIIGTSASVICYSWIVVMYVMFKDLRTIPGLNNCCMCISLLISDISFLTAIGAHTYHNACIAIAVIMHWSLLASFTWVLIISYDLVSRFGSFNMHSRDRDLERMTYRSAIGFVFPAVVVSIAIGLDRANKVTIGYGAYEFCWITNTYARLGLYVIPTSIALILALMAMVYSVVKIMNEKRQTQKNLKGKQLQLVVFLKMAIKLSMILGLTELIGYIQIHNLTNGWKQTFNVSFNFVYTLTRSLRGVMLWLVYIYGGNLKKRCKKRVVRSLRKHNKKTVGNISSSSNMTMTSLSPPNSPAPNSATVRF